MAGETGDSDLRSGARDPIARFLEIAAAALPREACALALGRFRGDGIPRIDDLVPCRNAAPGLERFRVAPSDYLAVQREGRSRGLEIVGIAHSHRSGPPAPSPEDLRAARGLEGEEGAWIWLVASPGPRGRMIWGAYRVSGGRFRALPPGLLQPVGSP